MPILSLLVKSFLITCLLSKKNRPVFYRSAAAGRTWSVIQLHTGTGSSPTYKGRVMLGQTQVPASSMPYVQLQTCQSRNKASVYQGTMLPFNTLPGSQSGDLLCWVLVPFLFSSSLTASSFPRRLLWLSKCCNANRRKIATNCILSREINRHSYV